MSVFPLLVLEDCGGLWVLQAVVAVSEEELQAFTLNAAPLMTAFSADTLFSSHFLKFYRLFSVQSVKYELC